jgi:hypothetical protein
MSLSDRQHIQELHNALERRLDARMAAAGWHVDPTGPGDGVGRFRHPLNEDFAATAWFAWLGGDYPPLKVDSIIGVSYERSYRIWPYLTGGYPHSELQVGARDLVHASRFVELSELGEADRAVSQLVQPVLDRAIAWAEPFASPETLLAALRGVDDAIVEVMDIPVILAASGKIAEARQALLTAMAAHRDQARELQMGDFKLRFETWLAAGALPTPPEPVEGRDR